jgi:hypothetical protein
VVADGEDYTGHGNDGAFGAAQRGQAAKLRKDRCSWCGLRPRQPRIERVAPQQFPLRAVPLFRLPALSLLPGQMPAQLTMFQAVSNLLHLDFGYRELESFSSGATVGFGDLILMPMEALWQINQTKRKIASHPNRSPASRKGPRCRNTIH